MIKTKDKFTISFGSELKLITMNYNCWWFAVNFRWRSSPILFRFYRLSLPWCTLFSCIVGVFNNICCRLLKSAKRFSIANNSEKTNQIKRTRNKNRYDKKKARRKTRQNREKPNFKLFVILKSPEFLKGPIWQQSVMELRYSSPDGGKR